MARLTVLGTAFAIPDDGHDNTHFVLAGKERTLLIDCASNPVVRLKKAGVALDQVSDLFTHSLPPRSRVGSGPAAHGYVAARPP